VTTPQLPEPHLRPDVIREQERQRRNFLLGVIATLVVGLVAATWVRWPTGKVPVNVPVAQPGP
jgi:hypothetical protein